MKVRELTAPDIALFSRLIMDSSEFDTLTDLERRECESALTAAKAVVEDTPDLIWPPRSRRILPMRSRFWQRK